MGSAEAGKSAAVVILRDRERQTLDVVIRELEEDRSIAGSASEPVKSTELGLMLASLDDAQAATMGALNGVLVTGVDQNGVAASAGIAKGDVLVSFGQESIDSPAQFAKLVADSKSGQSVAILVMRNTRTLFVALAIP